MRNRSFALTSTQPPGPPPAEDAGRPTRSRRRARAAARPRNAAPTIRQVLEIAGETLWVVLLFLVIGFVVAKAPQIDAAIDEMSGVKAAPFAPVNASRDARVRDLEARFARYEARLAPIEKGYARLQQRHADLLKAYAQLQKSRVREAYQTPVAEARSAAAP